MIEVWRPDSGTPLPRLDHMTEWDASKVRIVECHDITWDAMVRRFDYLGPDGRHHHILQTYIPTRARLIELVGVKGRARLEREFVDSTLSRDEVIEILHDHWSKNNA